MPKEIIQGIYNQNDNDNPAFVNDGLSSILQDKEIKYALVLQDPTINALARITTNNMQVKPHTTTGIIRTQNGSTDLVAIIKEYSNVTIKQSTSKLLRILTMKFTQTPNKWIKMPLKEYMEITGLTNETKARASIKADLDALHSISCEARVESGKNKGDFIKFEMIAERGIKNGVIFANLTDSIYAHLLKLAEQKALMPYPLPLFKLQSNDKKNPYAQHLSDKIVEQKRYHLYEDTFQISVKTLLKVCIEDGMKPYEEIKNSSRHIKKLIIDPFERDLDACSELKVFEWEYCNEKGAPLTDAQLSPRTKNNKYRPQTYKEFESLYIKVHFFNYSVKEFNVEKCKHRNSGDGNKEKKKKGKKQ